mmetsp:Transcript_92615/g.249895  ORF Transcript_92615/g.249895 Transcript_92615/m.249895 type:complete len:336 (+) Transcript_92615:621-1628(+)
MDPAPMRLSRTADRILRDEPLMQGATSKVRPERDMSLWKRASRFSLQLITTLRTFSTAAAVIAAGRPEAVVVLPGFKEGVEAEAPELPEASGFFWAAVASGTCICNVKDCGTSMYPRSSGSWLAGSRSRTLQSRQNKSNKTAVMTGVLRPPLIQHRATTASASACGSLRVALAASSRGVAMGLPSWPTAPTSSNCSAASDSASSASSACWACWASASLSASCRCASSSFCLRSNSRCSWLAMYLSKSSFRLRSASAASFRCLRFSASFCRSSSSCSLCNCIWSSQTFCACSFAQVPLPPFSVTQSSCSGKQGPQRGFGAPGTQYVTGRPPLPSPS